MEKRRKSGRKRLDIYYWDSEDVVDHLSPAGRIDFHFSYKIFTKISIESRCSVSTLDKGKKLQVALNETRYARDNAIGHESSLTPWAAIGNGFFRKEEKSTIREAIQKHANSDELCLDKSSPLHANDHAKQLTSDEIDLLKLALVSPIRKLYSDILLSVLLLLFDDQYVHETFPKLYLMLVCSEWYSVVINASQMWTRIRSEETKYAGYDTASLERYVHTHVQRAGDLPLYVLVGRVPDDPNQIWLDAEGSGHPVLRVLLSSYPHKIGQLIVTLAHVPIADSPMSSMDTVDLPNLEHLFLYLTPAALFLGANRMFPFVRHPSIRRLNLGGSLNNLLFGGTEAPVLVPAVWQNIGELHLGPPISASGVLRILPLCSSLTSLVVGYLDQFTISPEEFLMPLPVTLVTLEQFVFFANSSTEGAAAQCLCYFLRSMTTLRLSRFMIGNRHSEADMGDELVNFFSRSGAELIQLSFTGVAFNIVSCLPYMPSLRHLILTSTSVDFIGLFKGLQVDPNDQEKPLVLPRLDYLSVDLRDGTDEDRDALWDAVVSRARKTVGNEDGATVWSEPLGGRVASLQGEGLNVLMKDEDGVFGMQNVDDFLDYWASPDSGSGTEGEANTELQDQNTDA
ncbi:hypothetical protein FISHEDRAFT_58631 [Fistulina hepatica ATCC 64428]|uniref:F-box domain-containing protein n=1 Tax=Fistulina hepatica ATCC 64428 TaxID=1128425 RepID=A0A0D7ADW8_9AGAR|nr:hypothetical protein FISHEDRAFT_58631 [Fistulina hepatica ATCC 64428]